MNSLIYVECLPAISLANKQVPIVLIHGWGNSSYCWQPLLSDLNLKHDLYLVDLPACGNNISTEVFSLSELMRDLESCLPPVCVLLGWSLGGMLATCLAATTNSEKKAALSGKKIAGLITLATNASFIQRYDWPWAMDEQTFNQFFAGFKENPQAGFKRFTALQALGDDNRKALLAQLEQHSQPPTEEAASTWCALLEILAGIDNREILNGLPCPGLHLFAANDALVPVSAVDNLHLQANQKTKFFADCAHALHLSRPQQVIEEIKLFIAELEQGSSAKDHKLRVARAFSQAASTYDATANLQRKVAENLVEMLELSTAKVGEAEPSTVLDLGCGTGFVSEMLQKKQQAVSLVMMDLSRAMLKRARKKFSEKKSQSTSSQAFVTADMDQLPFAENTFDLVVSSMSVQWSADTEKLLAQVYSCLKPGGRFLFATVGETTLHELAQAWREVDDYVHVNRFLSQTDILALAQTQLFSCDHAEREIQTQYFPDVIALMKNLKAVGAHTVNTGNNHGLTSRARLQTLQRAYENFRTDSGTLPASWEVLYFVLRKQG